VTPGIDERVEADARIEIAHAKAVTIALPDEDKALFTFARTVGELLEEADVTLGEGAVVVPEVTAEVTPGLAVRIVVLSASNEVEREFIESRTVYRTDPDLDFGATRTEAGHDGALVRRYAVSYANGIEADRELLEEYYDPEPLETVVYYPPQRNAGADAPSEGEVSSVLNVYATYYTPASAGRPPGDPSYGHTATGVLVTYGVVAVDPNVIPLGTRMFIPGYGYAIAADTGGAVKGYIIDLGYPDGVAVDWRSRWLDIYILS
jgi:3D (Asp-Asp-Asp) domain-containing protein